MFQSPVFTSRVFNSGVFTPMARGPRGVESEYALGFDGVNDEVVTTIDVNTLITVSAGSISLWLRPKGTAPTITSAWLGGIVGDTGGYFGIVRGVISGEDRLWAYNYSSDETKVGTNYIAGQWTHIVWVHDGGQLYLYKDGRLVGSVVSGSTEVLTHKFRMGRTGTDPSYKFFHGDIDDLRIYSRALTADEVSALYNNVTAPPTSGLVAHFPFEEGTGTSTVDSVGGLVGTLTNGPTWQPQVPPRLIRNRETEDWSVSFDGVNDYVSLASAITLTDNFTIAYWSKATSYTHNQGGTSGGMVIGGNDFTKGYIWEQSATSIQLSNDGETKNASLVYQASADFGWKHIVFVCNNGVISVYKNGLFQNSTAFATPFTITLNRIGGPYNAAYPYWGPVKDPRIYSSALPAASIAKLARGVEPTETPVAQWQLNEGTGTTANDSIGSNHGTLTNGPTWTGDVPQWFRQPIVSAQALSLDGVDDYVSLAGIVVGTTFSYSAWIKPGSPVRPFGPLLTAVNGSTGVYFRSTGAIQLYPANESTGTVTIGSWTHVFCSVAAGACTYYINGVAAGSQAGFGGANVQRMGIDDPSQRYVGLLDDPCLYNRALSAAEVADQAAGYLVTAGLVSRWKFDGNAEDDVGANDGTEQGGVGYSTSVPGTL